MNLKKWIYEKKADFLCRYRKKVAVSAKEELFSVLSGSPADIDALSFSRFKKIFAHAYEHSSFYREKYQKAGVAPEDIQTPGDIEKIPLLTREEIKENREKILCDNVARESVFLTSTGGSTGQPLFFYHEHAEPYVYMKQRFFQMLGLSAWDNGAMIIRRKNSFFNRCKTALWNWPVKFLFLNATMMTEESVSDFIRKARKAKVKYLWGYEGGLYHLASYLSEHNLAMPSIQCVISTSSPLPQAHREIFEKVFHCDVYDQYGSCEVQWLGTECPEHHGLHIPWDVRRIEFVDASGKNVPVGEYGDIVVTDLLNFSFPFIRYRNGDRGRRLEGKCSIPLPLMDSVKGRVSDLLKFADGSCISGEYLTTIFDAYPMAVKAFQVYQKKDYSIELRCIPTENDQAETEIRYVIEELKKIVGERAEVVLQKVAEIPHDRGKSRFVLSELSQ